ncbi:MAG: hypothetical protein H0V78_03285 [Burkholderiales bacterium]|nr:hypothetical protein [Burkholderiales bacterium]
MKRNPGKTMAKANQADSVAKSGKPNPALEFSSPPCYAHEFPGYFGEVEEGNSKQRPPKKQRG